MRIKIKKFSNNIVKIFNAYRNISGLYDFLKLIPTFTHLFMC